MNREKTRTIYRLLAALFWLAIWQIASMIVGKELILPGPFSVLKALGQLVVQGNFWLSILLTMFRMFTTHSKVSV